ncbi:MAG: apolipoprotein N-acyltransferase [Terriglobales bacterium]
MRQIHTSAWLLAGLSSALQVLIFPKPDLYWLCWIAYAPLLVAVLRARGPETLHVPESLVDGGQLVPARVGQGFLLAYVSGVIATAGTCYWIYHVMHRYGGLTGAESFGIVTLFCLYIGLHVGAFGTGVALLAGARSLKRRGYHQRAALVTAPFLWVGIELFRDRVYGFPWDLLGTVQVNNIALSRIATITGVYGISFEIMLVNTAFAAAFVARAQARRFLLAAATVAALVLQASMFIHPSAERGTHTARLVQQNIPIVETPAWSWDYFQKVMGDFRRQSLSQPAATPAGTGQLQAASPDVIVWPESPAPFFVNDQLFRDSASQLARDANAYLIAGTLGVKPGTPQDLYNSAALITPHGDWAARYDKIHLVPFGEYVPFKWLFGFARSLTGAVGNFIPGTKRNVFDLGRYQAGVFICYESIFPGEVRQFAANGAQLFINISNDGWFGESGAPGQHLNMARMRAVENHRWLLRSTNTGITAVIDPYGRIVARAPRNVRVTLDASFGVVSGTTFYTRHGDWFAWLCAIICIAALVAAGVQRWRMRQAPSPWFSSQGAVARR